MGKTLTQKILEAHLVDGELVVGREIGLRIDQTLTQDATGTMAYLQFEAIGIPRVETELSVSYVDHNTLQSDFKNADDHNYLRTVAGKYGVVFSRPGNGICHQLHLERFARPGRTLIGSDSHTPTAGGAGAFALGAGGLDVACAMAGQPFRLKTPKVVAVRLTGKLSPWVSAKDVVLELLRRIDVKGGVGKVLEYCGPGVATLSVPDRATITNMGTETGATTSIFPSDDATRAFLEAQGRGEQWVALGADADAVYDETIEIDLAAVVPMAACPHSPGAVKTVRELGAMAVNQVCIGSCTNSSLRDMKAAAAVLRGKTIAEGLHLTVNPGSRQVVEHLVESGELRDLVAAGARILPLRSNVPAISKFVFEAVDSTFPERAQAAGGGFIVGGENYGQGSSREHAALAPKYLGVKAVIVKSFARIHLANLINFGIVPLTFVDPADYDKIDAGDALEAVIGDLRGAVKLVNKTKGASYALTHTLSPLDAEILKAGGKLPWIKTQLAARA